jgi:hypothetical protein
MNPSLERYLEFRQMMIRQARHQRARGQRHSLDARSAATTAAERAVIERSALLEQAAESAEAMRWTLRAVRQSGTSA